MESMPQGKGWFEKGLLHSFTAVGTSLLLALALCETAWGQQIEVSGRVTSAAGIAVQAVTVTIRGTTTSTITDAEGKYALTAPSDGVLVFSRIGYRGVGQGIGGRTTINVVLEPAIAVLPEVVVTGYTEQRRADIVGAVSIANLESAARQTSASVLQRLDGRVAGITVDASGSPGSRSTVRIRGISSFQNNDPLYIVDGTPVEDSYVNWLNPSDIASVQVLKDAAAASIYGSRASNGVVIIETKKGRPGRRQVSLDVRTGVATPVRGYDDFLILDPLEYFEVVKRSHQNAGQRIPTNIFGDSLNPTIPQYTYAHDSVRTGVDQWGRPVGVDESKYAFPDRLIMPGSSGTNWWDAVFGRALVTDANLAVSGGGDDNVYSASFNYFRQGGTAAYNTFQRGTVRLNTAFDLGRVSVGENLSLSLDHHYGGIQNDPDAYAEDGIVGKNIFSQPVVPVYDIRGNFASGKANTLGNNTNPLKAAWAQKDNVTRNTRILGNVFAGFDVTNRFSVKTRFGFNLGEGSYRAFNPIIPENSEPINVNSIRDSTNQFTDWTWSNTLNYVGAFAQHNVAVLLGQEANKVTERRIAGGISDLINTDEDSRFIDDELGDADTKDVISGGRTGALLSFFGKIDYNFADKYYLSFTLRRDGSSRLGPSHRWGTFPALGAGWRLSQEPFLAGNGLFTNIMLRAGWGVTGNQNIPSGRGNNQLGGGLAETFYAITGANALAAGYRLTALGNLDLKWEENRSVNVGFDLEFLEGRGNATVDLFHRVTDDLLFDPPLPGTAGVADPPIVNIGKMRNRGIEFSLGYRGTFGGDKAWSVNFNGSHYKNKIVRIDNVQKFFFCGCEDGHLTTLDFINQLDHPIGSFYGLVADGLYADSAAAAPYATSGARPGRIRFRDLNQDGLINEKDRTIIGDPHPDFTAGLDLGVRWGALDVSATLFGTFGNQIFDVQKFFYVFRTFDANVRRDLLANSWTPANPNAKYPRLDASDTFSSQPSSFYVEDGSYVRLRNLQIGYTVPPGWIAWIPAMRVFVQAENLFTITGYDGLDPALPAANVTGDVGDIRDQARGLDRGTYPSSRTITFGVSTTF